MNNRKKIRFALYSWFVTGALVLLHTGLHAQQRESAKVMVIARPLKDSILLRWAPTTPLLWKMANQYGYTIRRYTILRKGQLLAVPEETLITKQPVKPLPVMAWEPLTKKYEQFGTIEAQALYGEGFEVSAEKGPHKGKDIMSIYHQSQELESRHSFALLAADQSFEVARAAGLGYVDKQVQPDEKYLYRVYIAAAMPGVKADTGFIFTGYADHQPVPAPHGLEAMAMKGSVVLSWDKTMYEHIFTSYVIERSDNAGVNFHSITEDPIINTSSGADTAKQQRFFRIDSAQADKPLVYRIRGVTPFGELSPPSDTVQVTVVEILEARPSIISAGVLDSKVHIQWAMPPGAARVSGFQVERAAAVNKPYQSISKRLLPATDTAFTDATPRPSNYYRIKALTKDGQVAYSLPYFVQLEDSLPPAPPAGVKGMVNDSGIAHITWQPNTEEDIYAYRVFRANDSTAEFIQVTKAPLLATVFTDTIEIKTLTREVYYKVVALDGHYNPSLFSPTLTLKRPDVVPPVPPSFTDQQADAAGVYLQWQPSSSKDVARHELLRSVDTSWQLLLVVAATDTLHAYTDTSAVPGVAYRYAVAAIDSSRLRASSQPLTASRINMGAPSGRKLLRAAIDRDNKSIVLRWQTTADMAKCWLYKAAAGQPFRLYKTLEAGTKEFVDTELFINTSYQYKMKVFKGTGGDSFFSEAIIVNY